MGRQRVGADETEVGPCELALGLVAVVRDEVQGRCSSRVVDCGDDADVVPIGGADFDPDDDALGDLMKSFELSDQRGRGCPDLLSRPCVRR